jgi:fluoride ion exporter CrcB/FEX
MSLTKLFLILLGGGIGAVLRYLLSMREGLVTLEKVRIIHYRHSGRK